MDDFRKQQHVRLDVGGIKCTCCNHFKGKHKSLLNRIARHKLKELDKNSITPHEGGIQVIPPWDRAKSVKPKFKKTYCSSCGQEFGPGNSGFSHCEDHVGRFNL